MKEFLQELRTLNEKIDAIDRMQREFYALDDAARFLGMSKSTLYKRTSAGDIAYYKPNGKLIVFRKEDLVAWLTKSKVPSNEEIKGGHYDH